VQQDANIILLIFSGAINASLTSYEIYDRSLITKMITKGDKILIKNLWESKKYVMRRFIKAFPSKTGGFSVHITRNWSVKRAPGIRHPCTLHTAENVNTVRELVRSQKDRSQIHFSTHQIARAL